MNGSKAPALFRYDDQTAVRVVTVDTTADPRPLIAV